jgi:ubiquinone/menaquinone biosynthesis C-methylase UbiE
MLRHSQDRYLDALRLSVRTADRWLDLGCGHHVLPAWMANQEPAGSRLRLPAPTVGVDLDLAALRRHQQLRYRVAADVECLPIASDSCDLVTANMVLEHVRDPRALFAEVRRVLRLGGTLLIHTPNRTGYTTMLARCVPSRLRPQLAQLLQGRDARDVYPTFYRANTPSALRALARDAGLSVAAIETVISAPQLYRLPLVRWLEAWLLRALERDRLGRWRPCIIASFVRGPGSNFVPGVGTKSGAAGRHAV